MSFHSGVFACLRTDGPPRPVNRLAALVVAALVAGMPMHSMAESPSASADASATVEAPSVGGDAAPVADMHRATGMAQGVNPGTQGQCTWGAAQKWFEASGSYPALSGNAMSWSDSAMAAGWTVVDDAQDRSMVVFQPGVAGAGSVGHVAWVDSVSQQPDGPWIHVTEMNNAYAGGVGIFNDRDIKDVPGMSYILLP
ncbi:MAG TPA: CHAP domain-containing protein [Mycobacterium sp.]